MSLNLNNFKIVSEPKIERVRFAEHVHAGDALSRRNAGGAFYQANARGEPWQADARGISLTDGDSGEWGAIIDEAEIEVSGAPLTIAELYVLGVDGQIEKAASLVSGDRMTLVAFAIGVDRLRVRMLSGLGFFP